MMMNSNIYSQKLNRGYSEFIGGKDFHPLFYQTLSLIRKWSKNRILDVGCGRGEVVCLAAKAGFKSYGIDNSLEAINLSLKNISKLSEGQRRNYSVRKMNAKSLKFKNGFFDTVLALDVTEHLYDWELLSFFKEANRVLSSGGKIIIHTPNANIMKPAILLSNFIGLKLMVQIHHVNEKSLKSWEKILYPYFKIEEKWFEKKKNFWSSIVINRGSVIKLIAKVIDTIFDNQLVDSLIKKSFLINYFGNGIWIVGTKLPI